MFSRNPRPNDSVIDEASNALRTSGNTTPLLPEHDQTMDTMQMIAGKMPTKGPGADSKVLLTRLSQFQHSTSSLRSVASAEQHRDGVLRAWAMVLHLYLVSDTVAFVLIGTGSKQLACSYWPSSTTYNRNPRLTFSTFEAEKHGNQVNTAVAFADLDDRDGTFSYVVQSAERLSRDLRLYTQHSRVPRKFASTVWNTLLEIHSDLANSTSLQRHEISLSSADKKALHSFLPFTPFDSPTCLPDLWRESVRTAPLAPAVDSWDGSLTYAELDKLSNRLAHQLLVKGVEPGDFVPFSFEKSVWMVVAMLGIVKAGAAFVAIDPSQPRVRAEEIMNQVHAKVMVVSISQAATFSYMGNALLSVASGSLGDDHESDPLGSSLPRVSPADPAVCIFTSGSTGKPKGIVVQHQALVIRMMAEGGALGFRRARCLQFAASLWDIFITDVFATLLHQGCICIPSEEDRLFNLADFCTNYNVTHAIVTPSLANMLTPTSFTTLRTLVFSGEALRSDVVARWSSRSGIDLYQGYGPAETGGCIIGRLTERAETIGHTLKNYICVLVDPRDHNRLVPIGAVGELLVAGPGLLQEYIRDPSRTETAIVEQPSWCSDLNIQSPKFYKTGDLLRYDIESLDGSLQFVGRTDGQVKLHGQRIELGEIEHNIALFPKVTSCMVTLVKEGNLKGQLVAVVQLNDISNAPCSAINLSTDENVELLTKQLKDFLALRLPQYMVPRTVFIVTNMPVNTSMKLDRAAINKWVSQGLSESTSISGHSPAYLDSTRLLPYETTAKALTKIYTEAIGGGHNSELQEFGDRDFNLQSGGIDSIQIMSFSTLIKNHFGVQVPMARMLSSKATIRSIASIIDSSENDQILKAEDQAAGTAENDVDTLLQSILLTSENAYHNSDISNVFLTGATGYLGIEILRQLVTQSTCQIFALVQGSSEQAARAYLIQKAVDANWWRNEFNTRIQIWPGDLSKPQLGLDLAGWRMLQGQGASGIDAIIHNGARVHYHMDYDSLQATNVSSTIELLKAVNNREKPLHSFVFVSGGQQLSFDEAEDTSNLQQALQGSGYARSKTMSELVVRKFAEQAEAKAKNVRVVKPGYIIGDADRGIANKNDFIWRYFAASIEMGAYDKQNANGWLFLTDISRVSETILHGVFDFDCKSVVKILDGIQFQDVWLLLQDEFSYNFQLLDPQEWLSNLYQSVSVKQEKHVMFPLMHMFERGCQPLGVPNGPSRPSIGVKKALRANIKHLIGDRFFITPGFVPTPPSTTEDSTESNSRSSRDAFDVQSIRKQFPALHGGVVGFNNAAGTAVHQGAIEGTRRFMSAFPIEVGLDDSRSKEKTEHLMGKTAELAAFMNADPDEIGKRPLQAIAFRCPDTSSMRKMANVDFLITQLLVSQLPFFSAF